MNNNLLYHPLDLDIRVVLREQADQLIETLDLPEIEELQEDENDNLLDIEVSVSLDSGISTPTLTELEKQLEEQLRGSNSQLLTPPTTLSIEPTPSTLSNEDETLPAAPRNQALHGNEISGSFDSRNIIQGSRNRTRRSAYITALGQTDKLVGYYASFITAVKAGGITKPPH